MNVLFHYAPSESLARDLQQHAEILRISFCDEADDARFHALLPEADAIWHVLRPLSADDIRRAFRLRLIQKFGVGVNTIDLDAARAHGVAVCNMPGINARSVAEMSLLLILACLRRLAQLDAATRAGAGWQAGLDLRDGFHELAGKTVGLIGYGSVPRILAPILKAMGAEVIYTAIAPKDDSPGYCDLLELIARSDIVSLHVPLNARTERMIGRDVLWAMKPGSVLVNTARGGVIDQDALIEALRAGQIGCAGLDVFRDEPIKPPDPLLSLQNVIVTPHIAWLTAETLMRSVELAVENCRRLERGEPLLNRVV